MTRTSPAKTRDCEPIAIIGIDVRVPGGAHAPATPLALQWHKRPASRNRALALLLGSVAAGAMQLPEHALAETKLIETPAHARLQGLESLRRAVRQDGGVPLPADLDDFIKNREAALQLGKALFWDMQVGSDGVQACASCHFHAGTDNRSKNAINPAQLTFFDTRNGDVVGYFNADFPVSNPPFETRQPNETLTRDDFPFVKSIQDLNRTPEGERSAGLEQQQRHRRVDGHVIHPIRWRAAGVSR